MSLYWGVPEYPQDNTVSEKHAAEALDSAVKSLIHAIRTENKQVQQVVGHQTMQIAKPFPIRRRREMKLENGKTLVMIMEEHAHLVHLKRPVDEQAKLKTLVDWYTSQGASAAWRVYRC